MVVDPLSVASSIAGLASLADSLFRLVFKYVNSVKGAKVEIQELTDEMKSMAGILHSLSLLASSLEDEPDTTLLLHHVHSCHRTMSRIKQPLVKAEKDLESDHKLDALQRKLKWPFKSTEIKGLLTELSRHKETITLALAADSMGALARCLSRQDEIDRRMVGIQGLIERNMEITTRINIDSNRQKVLSHFLTVNPQQNLEMSLKLRHPLTGLWLTEGPIFQQWLEVPCSKLWLAGIPGGGKTVLAGAMIENVLQHETRSTAIAFFFCDHIDARSHDTANILAALASQMARQNDTAFELMQDYYYKLHPRRGLKRSPDVNELVNLIKALSCEFDQTFIIVDAVDECGDKNQVANVIRALKSLVLSRDAQENTDIGGIINLALLSRDEDPIRGQLQDEFIYVQISAHVEDLQIYTAAEVDRRIRDQLLRIDKQSHKDEIIDQLVAHADGMFRWVSCQIDELCKLATDKARRKALTQLPQSLNATYERILERVNDTNDQLRSIVQKTLLWIAFSDPPLTIAELCEAISIGDGGVTGDTTSLDPEDAVDEREIAFSCSSLICKSNDGEHFQFAHFTVKEFLEALDITKPHLAPYRLSKSKATHMLALVSLRFLCAADFARMPKEDSEELQYIAKRNRQHPFYEYATMCWHQAARDHWDDKLIFSSAIVLFDNRKTACFSAWSLEFQRHYEIHRAPHYTRLFREGQFGSTDPNNLLSMVLIILRRDFTPLHMAALLGISRVCEYLLQHGAKVNLKGIMDTPLACALVGPILFATQPQRLAEDLEISVLNSSTSACEEVISLLLRSGANIVPEVRKPGWTMSLASIALIVCLYRGDFAAFSALVQAGMDCDDALSMFEYLADTWAARDDAEGFSRLQTSLQQLMSITRPPNEQSGNVPNLYKAAWKVAAANGLGCAGLADVTQLSSLAGEESIIEALMTAVRYNDRDALLMLTTHEKVGSFLNSTEETPLLLHVAASYSSIDVMDVLLGLNFDISRRDEDGKTPLLHCDTNELKDTLRVLMEHGADPTVSDSVGDTIWHLAAANDAELILGYLFTTADGIDSAMRVINHDRRTPLAEALYFGSEDATLLILKHCQKDPEYFCSNEPILQLAALLGSDTVLTELLNTGIGPQPKSPDGTTPLHCLSRHASVECVEILMSMYTCERRADGRSPAELFLWEGEESEDEDTDEEDDEPNNSPEMDVLRALLTPESIISTDNDGKTTWEYFCSKAIVNHARTSLNIDAKAWLSDAARCLVDTGAFKNYEEHSGCSGFLVLVKCLGQLVSLNGHFPWISKILLLALKETEYIDQAMKDAAAISSLQWACITGTTGLVEALLVRGLDVQKRIGSMSALEHICILNTEEVRLQMFRLVLDHANKARLDERCPALGDRPLTYALANTTTPNRLEKLRMLLEAGADPSIRDKDGCPLLLFHILVGICNTSAVILLQSGADYKMESKNGWNVVLAAVSRNNVQFLEELRVLVDADDEIWQKSSDAFEDKRLGRRIDRLRSVHIAATNGHTDSINYLLDSGLIESVDVPASGGVTAVHFAALWGRPGVIKLLHSRGANLNARADDGSVALHYAVQHREFDTARALLELGAEHDCEDSQGLTPLKYAYRTGLDDMISLLKAKEDHLLVEEPILKKLTFDRRTTIALAAALEHSIERGDLDTCKALFQQGCSIDGKMPKCRACTPLLLAIQLAKYDIVSWLIENDSGVLPVTYHSHPGLTTSSPGKCFLDFAMADRNACVFLPTWLTRVTTFDFEFLARSSCCIFMAIGNGNLNGLRALLSFIRSLRSTSSSPEIASSILNHIINLRFPNDDKWTPLHYAISIKSLEAVGILIENGADLDLQDNSGSSPLHIAAREGLCDILDCLVLAGASVHAKNGERNTPLMIAAAEGKLEAVRKLVEYGADLSYEQGTRLSALHMACKHPVIFSYLCSVGADPTTSYDTDITAAQTAFGASESRAYLLHSGVDLGGLRLIAVMPTHAPSMATDATEFAYIVRVLHRRYPDEKIQSYLHMRDHNYNNLMCDAAFVDSVKLIEALLAVGCDFESEDHRGTALMVACSVGAVDSVKFLVRQGARLTYSKGSIKKSAVIAAKLFPVIVDWLLLHRFTEQGKLEDCANIACGDHNRDARPWSGVGIKEFRLVGIYEKRWEESLFEYAMRLETLRRELHGKVVAF